GSLVLATEAGEPIGVAAAEHPTLSFKVVSGPPVATVLARGQALVGTGLARRHHLRPGDRLRLPTPTGFAPVTVGAVWENPNNNGSAVFMTMPMLTRLFGPQPFDNVVLRTAPGVRPADVRDRVLAPGLDPPRCAQTET